MFRYKLDGQKPAMYLVKTLTGTLRRTKGSSIKDVYTRGGLSKVDTCGRGEGGLKANAELFKKLPN